MRVLIVSDTHGYEDNLRRVLLMEKAAGGVDVLIHAGDLAGSDPMYPMLFRGLIHMVRGNNDFGMLPNEKCFTLGGHSFYLTHGHMLGVYQGTDGIADKARAKGADIAIFGHTHVPLIEDRDGIKLINPGSLTYPRQSGRRPSYVIMTLEDGAIDAQIRYL